MCGIKDYEKFWKLIDENAILTGESYAIQKMMEDNIRFDSIKFEWYDSGNKDILEKARERLKMLGNIIDGFCVHFL